MKINKRKKKNIHIYEQGTIRVLARPFLLVRLHGEKNLKTTNFLCWMQNSRFQFEQRTQKIVHNWNDFFETHVYQDLLIHVSRSTIDVCNCKSYKVVNFLYPACKEALLCSSLLRPIGITTDLSMLTIFRLINSPPFPSFPFRRLCYCQQAGD